MDKLIITADKEEKNTSTLIRVSNKANALVDDLAKRSGRSKVYILGKLIEFAYEHSEVADESIQTKESEQ